MLATSWRHAGEPGAQFRFGVSLPGSPPLRSCWQPNLASQAAVSVAFSATRYRLPSSCLVLKPLRRIGWRKLRHCLALENDRDQLRVGEISYVHIRPHGLQRLPQARSNSVSAARTRTPGRVASLRISAPRVRTASLVCCRASSCTSRITRGRPPGLPLWPFLHFPLWVDTTLFQSCSEQETCARSAGDARADLQKAAQNGGPVFHCQSRTL
jgi:hypothetical protein